ncbi:hypothetical protein WILDE_94 [Arthrobacter phage Wilde]|uniref:Uncharacterized protein n=1 Tax=Arthrobacter phage Wilde TaxID=1772323 RepID=A0A0U4K4A4_9CAUD|nr:hypothetical protein WILDE_94 [Arthrobacter phage Wilde]
MPNFYITFGQKYRHEPHPLFKNAHPDGWVRVIAATETEARNLVASYIGPAWAFCYDEQRFDPEAMKMRFYPKGELALVTMDGVSDEALVQRYSPSSPEFYGQHPGDHLGNRIVGKLLESPSEFYDVEYFHDDCLAEGYGLFAHIEDVDTNVISFEMDWASRWTCAVCKRELGA